MVIWCYLPLPLKIPKGMNMKYAVGIPHEMKANVQYAFYSQKFFQIVERSDLNILLVRF